MKLRVMWLAAALAGLALFHAAPAMADDIKEGAKVFNKCKTCHLADKPDHRVGPSLKGVFGRKAGTAPGFKYSKQMQESGVVWTEETIAKYAADPKGFIPGNKMVFVGLKKKDEIEHLIAYLKSATN